VGVGGVAGAEVALDEAGDLGGHGLALGLGGRAAARDHAQRGRVAGEADL
jgi:hypothetical protein